MAYVLVALVKITMYIMESITIILKGELKMNDRVKVGLGISGIAAAGFAIGRGLEVLGKKAVKKFKEIKAKKENEEK